jgi:hypothetical protein
MIGSLRSMRLSRLQLAVVAGLSALASALIITDALGQSAAQEAARAALAHPQTVVSQGPAAGNGDPTGAPTSAVPAAGPVGGGGASGGGSGSASSSSSNVPTASGGAPTPTTPTTPATNKAPKHKVGHVFVIALSTPSFDAAWGSGSVAHYLDGTLKPSGAFLGGYETLGSTELPDYLALVSGQAPNPDTEANCSTYSEFPAGAKPASDGQVPGSGCVYPNTATTIADQVTASGKVWRGYIDGLTSASCVHPNSGAADNVQLPGAGPDYATRHNPFIYFHSLLDLGGCSSNDVSLTKLQRDLRSVSSASPFSFIAPGSCEDGSAQSCPGGKPAGLAGEDAFLRQWVPRIEHSPAYKHDGVIVIVFALSGAKAGGGPAPTGALILSRFAARGKRISTVLNPYSILRGTEDLLGYQPLAHATNAKSFVAQALPGA